MRIDALAPFRVIFDCVGTLEIFGALLSDFISTIIDGNDILLSCIFSYKINMLHDTVHCYMIFTCFIKTESIVINESKYIYRSYKQ